MTQNKMREYTDKYFLRANEILKKDGLNPWVNMQVFVRKGPGKVAGINEAVDLILDNSNIAEVGGRIYAKKEGSLYYPKETLMNIIAPAQSIMELETVYLGVIAAAMTKENDKRDIDLNSIKRNIEQVAELVDDRSILYFGARHWHYEMDKAISRAAFEAGASDCSTDNGAETRGKRGIGTIPHALENIYAYKYGLENAVVESTKAFDKYMSKEIPRVALVDYANKEITDSINTANALNGNLNAVRIDTCGENLAEGAKEGNRKYWEGKGVTVSAAYALREALGDKMGIVLSSGFSNPEKIKAFNQGEKHYGVKLYDSIGAGFLDGVRTSTADIIAIGESPDEVDLLKKFINGNLDRKNVIHKVGRPPILNERLEEVLI